MFKKSGRSLFFDPQHNDTYRKYDEYDSTTNPSCTDRYYVVNNKTSKNHEKHDL